MKNISTDRKSDIHITTSVYLPALLIDKLRSSAESGYRSVSKELTLILTHYFAEQNNNNNKQLEAE